MWVSVKKSCSFDFAARVNTKCKSSGTVFAKCLVGQLRDRSVEPWRTSVPVAATFAIDFSPVQAPTSHDYCRLRPNSSLTSDKIPSTHQACDYSLPQVSPAELCLR